MKETSQSIQFRYLDIITALFVTALLISNVSAAKIISFGTFAIDGGGILFPLTYIFGDVLTEVYGYKKSRRVIWIGFVCALLMSLTFLLVGVLPPAADWPFQQDFMNILGVVPRIVIASLVAYLCGEFINSFILAKLKVMSAGKWLFSRTISSTLVGQLVDTTIFMFIAFWGVLPTELFISVGLTGYLLKCGVEILFTPITYLIVNGLKKAEKVDVYDKKTNFNPFTL